MKQLHECRVMKFNVTARFLLPLINSFKLRYIAINFNSTSNTPTDCINRIDFKIIQSDMLNFQI